MGIKAGHLYDGNDNTDDDDDDDDEEKVKSRQPNKRQNSHLCSSF